MKRLVSLALVLILAGLPTWAARIDLQPAEGALSRALQAARPGDEIVLAPGHYAGPVRIEISLTLTGGPGVVIDGGGIGSVITVDAADVTVQSLTLINSGRVHEPIDAGIKLTQKARRAQVLDNELSGNLVGIDIHGARDALVKGNRIIGLQLRRMNDRGNGIYVWNAPGSIVEDNEIRFGRDGIFSNVSKRNIYRGNLMRDLRFAVHYMSTNDSEVSDNVSIGNHLGFAMMYSDRIVARDNISINDRDYGVMLNYANQSDIFANQVIGGAKKCTFVYNSHRNLIAENRFDGCDIGIHFTAGSERNTITGNAFVGNRTQVKYVGTRDVEWSFDGRGNFWSDHPSFDLNGDSRADSAYRPNDLMDHILWSQPAAKLLIGTPAVQLVRWSQEQFPAIAPGGVVDSHPLIAAPDFVISPDLMSFARATAGRGNGASQDDAAHIQPD
ncbi:nitrous oxide reductase family maturation protein NosD [Pseudooceanicola sp.]|uniref:nitrous oxide reductase family maturation protein NosD n=1 Tax=Pseudooceanicola sp. TaxID=1914328 RepID=UPI002628A437|nr:nitrous oxide reductase family maturation protein NosD [Pseudooceanicola sp.]MDF1856040.1 nitrous oxide reductase family maturation protein NosD [Pseudooceanicola sp.]